MIPVKLSLKNFMSYGDPAVTLSFEGLHVACLAGDNGNGKSAILDGITWTLWGRTRASTARSVGEDDLIRAGSDEVEVRFEFELAGQRYRVVKKRKRGKSSEWQLAQLTTEGVYTTIGGGSQRETGKQIVQLLSMEYDTFVNSAYLQQGRADEFTRQTPDSRKRILGEILGLDRYDRLESKARDRMRASKEIADELEGQLRVLESQIGRLPEFQTQLEQTRAILETVRLDVGRQEIETAKWRDQRSKLQALGDQEGQAQAQVDRLIKDLRQREKERAEQESKLVRLQETLTQREAITSDFERLQIAIKRRDILEPEVEAFNRATADLHTIIGTIDLREKELRGDLRVAETNAKNAEARNKERSSLSTLAQSLKAELNGMPALICELDAVQTQQQAVQQEFAELSARNKEYAASLQELDEILELLSHPHAVCPVCESDISGQKHAKVVSRQQAKRTEMLRNQKEVQQAGRTAKQLLTAVQGRMDSLTIQRDEMIAKRNRLADANGRLEGMGDVAAEAAHWTNQVKVINEQLSQGDFAAPQRLQRQRLERELERLGLAKKEYEVVRQQISRLEAAPRRYQDLENAEKTWDQEQKNREHLDTVIANLKQDREKADKTLNDLRVRLAQFDEVARNAISAEAELRRLQAELSRLRVVEGGLLGQIAACEIARSEFKNRNEERTKADEDRRIFQALAVAFGKKGVQTLIIENAIPELEEEANDLLARMTDQGMQLRFVTTRSAKTGSSEIETLDIKITDDAGTRPYELFSGGEGFRINFAIRIALSRLLARRSGAKLQTLIMDEGFGSQDGKGREKLVEVIEAIKDDFEKILVITHVEDLKDAFTQRIEVTKDSAGSHIHVF